MRSPATLLLAVALAALVAAPALANDDDSTVSGTAGIGVWGTDREDSPDQAAEYEPIGGGPVLQVDLDTFHDWGALLISAHGRHSDEVDGSLDFDYRRTVRSHTDYGKLLHRLGHFPMTHLEATSTNGKVVRHTDLDPFQDYELSYSLLEHRTEIQFPHLSALTMAVNYREQMRDGHRQAFTTSHCDNCHIYSQSHKLNERTTQADLEASINFRGGHITGSFGSREHRQNHTNVWLLFDEALHPEKQLPLFDNRLQFDSDEGVLPVDVWPDIDKDLARLDLHLKDVGGFVVNGGGVWSETTNRYTGLSSDYTGYMVNAARRFDNGIRVRWRARVYSIDNDDVFVDTNERVTDAGPHAGQTYEDIYGVNYDWTRLSALNRDTISSKLDATYRFGRTTGTLRFLWDFESIDRDHYQVAPGETETTTNTLGVLWRSRPAKGWKVKAGLRHAEIDNPFMLVNGACSTLVSDQYPNPWNPETPQYDDQHQTRVADTTASPSSWDELKAGVSYTAGKTSVSGLFRWWDGDNSDGDLTDWSRTNQTATLTVWTAPSETWDWYLGYAWQDSSLEAPVCIPIFDG
jgi:hypothetical protein